ncbi:hypothetical protein [Kalamiella sp. sgz302252]|uniref:hypothetical protein n=1 Tax=Pantoea sp. sgz302252 TaxID=3341827 RepID=UPI0036D40B80
MGQLYDMSNKSEVLDPSNLKPHTPSYSDGNGGGGDMTERLERLEKKVEAIDSTLTRLNESIIRLDYKIDLQSTKLTSALELQSAKLTAALELQSQKLSSSLENQSLAYDGKLKDQRIAITAWVLGLPSVLYGLYRIIELFSTHNPS